MDNVDKLVGQLSEIIEKIQGAVITHAPDALALTLNVVRVDAASQILFGLVPLILGSIVAYRLYHWASEPETDSEAAFFICLCVGAPSAMAIAFGGNKALNVWNWVALWHPELRLAKSIFDAAMRGVS